MTKNSNVELSKQRRTVGSPASPPKPGLEAQALAQNWLWWVGVQENVSLVKACSKPIFYLGGKRHFQCEQVCRRLWGVCSRLYQLLSTFSRYISLSSGLHGSSPAFLSAFRGKGSIYASNSLVSFLDPYGYCLECVVTSSRHFLKYL
jgi:hypothetical protein